MTQSATDTAFSTAVEPDAPAPSVDYEDLRAGAIVRYIRTEEIKYTRDNAPQIMRKHVFKSQGGTGRYFGVIGTFSLNAIVRKLRPDTLLLLEYLGLGAADKDGKQPHEWRVRVTTLGADRITTLRRMEWEDRERAFEQAIDGAFVREEERRKTRRAGAAAPLDETQQQDDIPF